MKASILTFSQRRSIMNVGNAIADGLEMDGLRVEHYYFKGRDQWKPDDADMIGIGAPVFEDRPSDAVRDYLNKRQFDFKGKKAFVFLTSVTAPAISLWNLSQAVAETGAEVVGGIHLKGPRTDLTFFGVNPGRLHERDQVKSESFGKALAAYLREGKTIPYHYRVEYNLRSGLFDMIGPWLHYLKDVTTPLPEIDMTLCNLCGICISECPAHNIVKEKGTVLFLDKCQACYRCWHVCPRMAIKMEFSPANEVLEQWVCTDSLEKRFGPLRADEYVGPEAYRKVLNRKLRLRSDREKPTPDHTPWPRPEP